MNKYELTVILRTKDQEPLKAKVKDILAKNSVSIITEDPWGVKKLAYEIDNERDGYYYFAIVEAPAESVSKINAEFRLNADILRHLFVKAPVKKTA